MRREGILLRQHEQRQRTSTLSSRQSLHYIHSYPQTRDRQVTMEMYECILCGRPIRFGPEYREGRFIQEWSTSICLDCLSKNAEGIAPSRAKKLLAHLEARGIKAHYNAKELIDWPAKSD